MDIIKRFGLSKDDFGTAIRDEVKKRAQKQMLENVVQECEYCIGKIQHHQQQIDHMQTRIAIYERRVKAIESGAFTVDQSRLQIHGGVIYDDKELNDPNY